MEAADRKKKKIKMLRCSQMTGALFSSLLLASVATLLMTVSLATDHWEVTEFSSHKLRELPILNSSILNDENGYYRIFLPANPSTATPSTENSTTSTSDVFTTHHLRATNGGIWRICDRIKGDYRLGLGSSVGVQCFTYLTDYDGVKENMHEDGLWLVRMQNSAASCYIVTLLCLFTAVITGSIGLLVKQVSAIMVTGVMYVVAGTFCVFGLVIMHTKVSWMHSQCRSLDPLPSHTDLCSARSVYVGWSLILAWIAFIFCLFACSSWLFLARCLRLEKGKGII